MSHIWGALQEAEFGIKFHNKTKPITILKSIFITEAYVVMLAVSFSVSSSPHLSQ